MIAWSTFSGVGGMDLGLQRAGFDHACFAEIDPWRRDVLRAHWPGVPVYGDVRDVGGGGDVLGTPDLLCGGFPCQDLSVAGRRQGLAGARSGLFHEFARIADVVRPRAILLENVPGLLSSHDGRDMGTVIGTLADLGYGLGWRVLDARYFGVPQRRRRVFIVGLLGDEGSRAIRALCESCAGHPEPRGASWQVAAAGTPGGAGADRYWVEGAENATLRANGGRSDSRSVNTRQDKHPLVVGALTSSTAQLDDQDTRRLVVGPLTAQGNGGRGHRVDKAAAATGHLISFHQTQDPITEIDCTPALGRTSIGMGIQWQGGAQQDSISSDDGIAPTLAFSSGTHMGHHQPKVIQAIAENQRGEVLESDVARQLSGGGGKPGQGYAAARTATGVRRLTPVECERLMGWPDGWTDPHGGAADGRRYAACGDGVVAHVAEWIGLGLREVLT